MALGVVVREVVGTARPFDDKLLMVLYLVLNPIIPNIYSLLSFLFHGSIDDPACCLGVRTY